MAVNVFLVALIAWRIGGALAAIAGGIAAGASAFLNGFAATLYLDPLESSFVLLAIAALAEAVRRPRAWPFAAAGAAVGLSFLTKEAAVQYAPLGIAAWLALPALRTHTGARGAVAFTVAFAAVTIPWFGWVWVQTDAIFMLGDVSASSVALVALTTLGFGAFVAGVALWPSLPESRRAAARRLAAPAAVALVATWCALMLYMVESHDSWDYRVAYWSTIPRYLTTIAPAAQPYFLLVAAVVWMLYRALRGDDYARLLALFFVMFAPFAIVAANRSLQLRDALPMVYIAYIAWAWDSHPSRAHWRRASRRQRRNWHWARSPSWPRSSSSRSRRTRSCRRIRPRRRWECVRTRGTARSWTRLLPRSSATCRPARMC